MEIDDTWADSDVEAATELLLRLDEWRATASQVLGKSDDAQAGWAYLEEIAATLAQATDTPRHIRARLAEIQTALSFIAHAAGTAYLEHRELLDAAAKVRAQIPGQGVPDTFYAMTRQARAEWWLFQASYEAMGDNGRSLADLFAAVGDWRWTFQPGKNADTDAQPSVISTADPRAMANRTLNDPSARREQMWSRHQASLRSMQVPIATLKNHLPGLRVELSTIAGDLRAALQVAGGEKETAQASLKVLSGLVALSEQVQRQHLGAIAAFLLRFTFRQAVYIHRTIPRPWRNQISVGPLCVPPRSEVDDLEDLAGLLCPVSCEHLSGLESDLEELVVISLGQRQIGGGRLGASLLRERLGDLEKVPAARTDEFLGRIIIVAYSLEWLFHILHTCINELSITETTAEPVRTSVENLLRHSDHFTALTEYCNRCLPGSVNTDHLQVAFRELDDAGSRVTQFMNRRRTPSGPVEAPAGTVSKRKSAGGGAPPAKRRRLSPGSQSAPPTRQQAIELANLWYGIRDLLTRIASATGAAGGGWKEAIPVANMVADQLQDASDEFVQTEIGSVMVRGFLGQLAQVANMLSGLADDVLSARDLPETPVETLAARHSRLARLLAEVVSVHTHLTRGLGTYGPTVECRPMPDEADRWLRSLGAGVLIDSAATSTV